MGVSFEKFSFTKNTSTSVPVSQEINLSGAFQPKALILWTNRATGTTFEEHASTSIGFSDGTNDAVVAMESEDNAGSSAKKTVARNDAICVLFNETTQAELSRASVTSFDADGFTLSWDVNGTGNPASIIHGVAIGGTDITNVKVLLEDVSTTSTGNFGYTGVGFSPDFIMLLSNWFDYNTEATTIGSANVGCAISTSKRWAISTVTEGANTMDTWSYHLNNKAITMVDSTGVEDDTADFVSFDSDGFTLNWSNAPYIDTDTMPVLCIKGGAWDVGTLTQPDATGNQNITTTGITTHKGAMFFTHGQVISTAGTPQAHNRFSIGGIDGTRQGYTTFHDTDNVGTSIVTKIQNTDGIIRSITAAATASSSTTQNQASFSSFSSNTITINWSTIADTTDRVVSWWTVGEAAAGTQYNRSPSAENTTISDSSLTRLLSAARIPSTDTSTISETSLTRMTQAFRVPSTDTSTVSEQSLTAAKVKSGIPSADTTTVTDSSLVRLLSSTRVPSTETETINDSSLTRMLSTSRAASDRVTVGEGSHLFVIHVPLYIYPFHWIPASEWYQLSDIMAANPDVLFILKLNVNSGPDTAVNTDYETGIDILKGQGNASHVKLIGYVYTSYGARAIADVKTDIDRWQTFYGSDINGIFLDEMENDAGEEAYYQELTNYIHNDKGMEISWGNPGVPIAESYVKANAVDVFQISESADYPTASAIENATFSGTYSPSKFAMGIHSVTSYNSSLISEFNTDVAYIFVTGDEMPTPYDTISAYLDDLALQANNIPKATKAITRIRAPTAEDNITISDVSLIRLLSSIRVPSTETEIISDSALTRIYSSLRLPSQDTTSLSEDITSEKTAGAQVIERAPSADSTTITESSLVRLYSSLRLPSTDTIIITEDSLVRLLQAFRTPEQDTITIGESVSGGKLFERVPSFDTTTITEDGISRLLSAARAADSDTIGLVDETLTRATQAFRTPSTDDITVSDTSLDRIKSLSRTPSTDSESVTDSSLTRLLSASRALEESENISDFSLTRLLSAIRIPSQDTTNLSEDVTGQHITAGQFNRSVGPDTVILTESSLTRLLQLARLPTTDTTDIIDSSLVGLRNLPRIPSTDTITISDSSLIRLLSLVRTPSLDSTSIIDSSLTRMLQSFRLPSVEVISVNESLSGGRIFPRIPTTENVTVTAGATARALSSLRVIEESIESIEASLSRMLSSIRSLEDIVTISEVQAFLTQIRMIEETIITGDISLNTALVLVRSPFVESVTVSELLSTTGGTPSELVVYATVDEVRMLLGNLGAQRATNDINRAIEAATDTINRRTNRIPPYNWRSTEEEFDLIKKLARYIAALEMSIGISGFEESRTEMQKEIEEIFTIIEEHDPGGITSNDMVVTSESATYPSNTEEGIIWSTRYKDLGVKKRRIRFRR